MASATAAPQAQVPSQILCTQSFPPTCIDTATGNIVQQGAQTGGTGNVLQQGAQTGRGTGNVL
ncbi:hypothetical protein ACFV1C_11615, partial [Streptomyces sp. NPDC059605]|uniref:hypothetical protein n=1 Tax=unclassified Streptomyces TaxID=2593676 RepID=UPI00369CAB4E